MQGVPGLRCETLSVFAVGLIQWELDRSPFKDDVLELSVILLSVFPGLLRVLCSMSYGE